MSPETTFVNPFATLQLHRWPRRPSEKLRAWDSADLYLLEHLSEQAIKGPYLLCNDLCGALALSLTAQPSPEDPLPVLTSGDSFMAQQAMLANAKENSIQAPRWLWPDESLPQGVATVVMRIPKSMALFEYQLHRLSSSLVAGTPVIITGIDKHLPPNLLSVMGRYLSNPKAGLGRHKARLFFGECITITTRNRWPSRVVVPELNTELQVEAGVFSQDSLDLGARFFLPQIPSGLSGTIADLGCGNGVLGLVAAQRNPAAQIWFCDESAQAIRSARANATAIFPGRSVSFHHGNGLDGLNQVFDLILLNPPFHRGHAIDDGVAQMLFVQARKHLSPQGQLLVIGNRQLHYQQPLRRLFRQVQQLAADQRFTILKAGNRE